LIKAARSYAVSLGELSMIHRILVIAAILIPGTCFGQGAPVKRPNVLWITCEDMGPHLGCYGDSYAVTPHLDALAKKSLRYKRVWSNAPVCAPARTTIITGIYPPSTGAHHMRSLVPLPGDVALFPVLLRRLGYYCTNKIKEDYNLLADGATWDMSSAKAHFKNRKPNQPFFAVFNFEITHESQIRKRPHKLVHDPARAPVPPYHPDTPEVRHDWAQYYDNITTMDEMVGQLLAELEAAGLANDTIVIFFSDHGSGMPRNKRTPLNGGLHVPMIVHIPAAFRDLAPSDYKTDGVSDRLVSFVDLAPTMLSLAGERPPAFMQGRAFLGKHIAPAAEHLFGFRGRMDERYDVVRTLTDGRYVYARNFMPHWIAGQHVEYMFETPTTAVWKKLFDQGKLNPVQSQFWKPRPAEELYDLQGDPHETVNLAARPEHAAIIERFQLALMKHLGATRDLGFLAEDDMHDRARGSTPLEIGRDNTKYPSARIIETAWTMTRKVNEPVPAVRIRDSLADADAAIRYWTVVGIRSRGEPAVREHSAALAALLNDPAPSVRILAAEALGVYGDDEQTRRALKTLEPLVGLDKNSIYVSLQALNALDAMGARARSAWPTIEHAADADDSVTPRVRGMAIRLVKSIRSNLMK
jgi:arylsulfatase A-like enzyme